VSDDDFCSLLVKFWDTLLCGMAEHTSGGMRQDEPVESPFRDTETSEGDVVIYDTRNEQAWIQSDTTITVGGDA
jgi:hypothetical protein